ncbi:ATP-dependent DNA helicase RecG [Alteribacter natronophilus]|uniref:ATP-dependent DNA helicase RecG n=1 Tax=Alteribacter natronophilus TaxID=2583810 RepID=UPI00110DFD39|nr:ATP-dependent DNA helicase RecG [Alteribacter natronophilus]TMW74062.1 ATP-dependent DNA helicase RecG [Alteribacter natronophilus]
MQPVSEVKGVGERSAELLASLSIHTIGDLLEHFPFRHEDYAVRPLEEIAHDERATVRGIVHSEPALRFYGKKKSRLTVRLLVDGLLIQAVFFNQHYLKSKFVLGEEVVVTGKWDRNRAQLTPAVMTAKKQAEEQGLDPVYPLKGDLKMSALKKWIREAMDLCGSEIEETLPEQLIRAYKLMERKETIRQLHFPSSPESLKQAKRRMVYEELLLFQLKMQTFRKQEREQTEGQSRQFADEDVEAFVKRLPFPLTGAQEKVKNEILKDLRSGYRMNRLLQGDVGSGKTVVAAIALFACVRAGFQGALMVPTEILAEQHAESLQSLLASEGITVRLLSGSSRVKERREILGDLASGKTDILIGTHALIQDGVDFQNLGLVITDEQHRFGVNQRRVLREKGLFPDVLFMTATPIPRTLAISVFGDMDVSVIDEMPKGRKPIETYWARPDMFARVLAFMEKQMRAGHQVYVICPLIEESDKLDVQNAIDIHAKLTEALPDFACGLMHGRLDPEEKDEVMKAFAENRTRLLVSTTVVEVGVNVPNATLMVIYDAERFGLAQLHQLRGRVGRGSEQSYCILLADPKSETGKERMRVMTETNDGFELSERDLELRGPGDFFGRKQSGLPEFKVADLVHDYRVLEVARQDAARLVESDAFWTSGDYKGLRDWLEKEGVFEMERLD